MRKLYTLILLAFVTNTQAQIIRVPADYATIQAAIGACSSGDTIVVAPGTYFENINYRGKKIVLTSMYYLSNDTSYISKTIINGSTPLHPDTASCVIFNSGEDSTTVLQGFTLTGGTGTKWLDIHGAGKYREGGGILIELSSPTIRYNYIVNNLAVNLTGVTSAGGGGIRIGDGNPLIEGNVIAGNQAKYGPGIVLNYTGCIIRNNVIASNTGGQSFNGGSGIWITSGMAGKTKIIENNTIVNNTSTLSSGTGGILVWGAGSVIIRNNIIWGNKPLSTQIKQIDSIPVARYNDVQNGYAGAGNIDTDPMFDASCFTLQGGSPCIDKGDSSLVYNDQAVNANTAKQPSQGTPRNDIGAFGGPHASLVHCVSLVPTGITETLAASGITVFPNPMSGNVIGIVFASGASEIVNVRIINVLGQLMCSKSVSIQAGQGSLSLEEYKLPAGLYKLQFTKDSNYYPAQSVSFIKQD